MFFQLLVLGLATAEHLPLHTYRYGTGFTLDVLPHAIFL